MRCVDWCFNLEFYSNFKRCWNFPGAKLIFIVLSQWYASSSLFLFKFLMIKFSSVQFNLVLNIVNMCNHNEWLDVCGAFNEMTFCWIIYILVGQLEWCKSLSWLVYCAHIYSMRSKTIILAMSICAFIKIQCTNVYRLRRYGYPFG